MSGLLLWVALFGMWPLADPGHDDLSSLLVWLDLAMHAAAGLFLLNRVVDDEVERRLEGR